jgi:mRNA interferase MazF
MINYQPGDLVLVAFPFTGGGSKVRPALVLLDTGDDDILVAR